MDSSAVYLSTHLRCLLEVSLASHLGLRTSHLWQPVIAYGPPHIETLNTVEQAPWETPSVDIGTSEGPPRGLTNRHNTRV